MEDQTFPGQVPSSIPPEAQAAPAVPGNRISAQDLELMKARARELAVQQTLMQQAPAAQAPRVVYVRRNFTVAEIILVFALSCGIVSIAQAGWNFVSSTLPRLEIKIK
jgi:hypothetical protein